LSHFGIGIGGRNPAGGAVILGGWLKQETYGKADAELQSMQSRYPNYQLAMLENVGTGSAYWAHARRTPGLRLITSDVVSMDKEKVVRSKDHRAMEMAVWFESGTLKIADRAINGDDGEYFLEMLRYLFNHIFELNKNYAHPAWDAGDAVYQVLKGMPDVLQVRQMTPQIRQPGEKAKVGLGSAWNSLAKG